MTGSISDWYADRADSSFGDAADDERVEWHPCWDVDDETARSRRAQSGAAAAPIRSGSAPSSSTVSREERQRIRMAAALHPDDSLAELVGVLGRTYTFVSEEQVGAVLRDAGIVRPERPERPERPDPSAPSVLSTHSPATRTADSSRRSSRPPTGRTMAAPSGVVEHLRPLRPLRSLHRAGSPAAQSPPEPPVARLQTHRRVVPSAYLCQSCGTTVSATLTCRCS